MKITHYDALNVSGSATPDVIEAAYRNLVQQHQAIGSLESQNRLNLGKYAYEILSKPEARIHYDKQISADHRSEPPSQVDLLEDNRDFGGAFATWWRSRSSLGISVAIAVLIGLGYYFRGNSEQDSVAKSESIDALQRPGNTLDIASTTKQSGGAINLNQNSAESKESSSNESAALLTNSPGLLTDPIAPQSVDDRNDSGQLTKSMPKASNLDGEIGSGNSGNKSDVGSIEPPKMQEVVRQQQETQRLQLQQQQMQLQATQKQLELQRLQQEAVQRQLAAMNEQQKRQQEDIHFQRQMQTLKQPQPPSQQIIGPQLQQQVIQPQVQLPQVQLQPQTVQSQRAQTQQQLQAIQIQADQFRQQQRQQQRQDCLAGLPSQAAMSKAIDKAGHVGSTAGLIAQRRAICDSMQ